MKKNFVPKLLLLATAVFLCPLNTAVLADDAIKSENLTATETGILPENEQLENQYRAKDSEIDVEKSTESEEVSIRENDLSASESIDIKADITAFKELHLEPFGKTSIKKLNNQLNLVATFSQLLAEEQNLLLSLVENENEDRFFRRSCEYLIREARQNSLKALNALIVFPRLLRIFSEIELNKANEIITELAESKSGQNHPMSKELKQIFLNLESGRQINKKLYALQQSIKDFIEKSNLVTRRRRVSGEIPDLLRNHNYTLNHVVTRLNESFASLINQFGHHLNAVENYHSYVGQNLYHLGKTKAAVRLTQVLRSCRDFKVQLQNFEDFQGQKIEELQALIDSRGEQIEKMVAAHPKQKRIENVYHQFPERDKDLADEVLFSCEQSFLEMTDYLKELSAANIPGEMDNQTDRTEEISLKQFTSALTETLRDPTKRITEIFKDFTTNSNDFSE